MAAGMGSMAVPAAGIKREYPAAPILAVGVVVRKENQVLLIRRNREPSKGLWTFPGGAVELGEGVREAAQREVCEETGLEVEIGEVAAVIDSIHHDEQGAVRYHYVIVDFYGRPMGGQLQAGDDVSEVRWVSREEAEALPMPQVAQTMVRELLGGAEADRSD